MSLNILSKDTDIVDTFGERPVMAATIRLTKGCNLRCPHCYVNAGLPAKGELSLDEIKSVVDQLSEMKVFYVFYTGGEPFIRRDIVDILKYTNEKGIGISISTNGTVLNERTLNEIRDIPFKLFQVSLDGTKDIHDKSRGINTWEKSIRTIKMAKLILKKNIGIGTVITKDNFNIIDKVLSEGARAGADTFTLLCLILTGRADDEQNPTPKEFLTSIEAAFKKYAKLKKRLKIAKDTTIPPALLPKFLRDGGDYLSFAPCSFPYYLGINCDGAVAPCDGLFNFEEMVIGNVREEPLAEIWKKSKLMRELIKINPQDLDGVCKKCIYRDYCSGGCRAHAYIRYKSFTMPDPVCQTAYEEGLFPEECLK